MSIKIIKDKEYIVLDKNEPILTSIIRDSYTFSFMLLCIYVGRDSRFWTFVTGSMFLLFLFGLIFSRSQRECRAFRTIRELADWANKEAQL